MTKKEKLEKERQEKREALEKEKQAKKEALEKEKVVKQEAKEKERVEKERLYKGKGGEIMRAGVCHLIYAISISNVNVLCNDLSSWHANCTKQ